MTEVDVYSAMMRLCTDAWLSGAAAIAGTIPELRYGGVMTEDANGRREPPANSMWALANVRFEPAYRKSMGRPALYETKGALWLEIYAPAADARGKEKSLRLAELVRDVYRQPLTAYPQLHPRSAQVREMLTSSVWNVLRLEQEFVFYTRQ